MKLCPRCLRCYDDLDDSCANHPHDSLAFVRPGTRVIDQKYRLDKLLGRGGTGAVYECTHIELNRPRAIKLLIPEFANTDPHGRLRLRREALTACKFDHRNLVCIYDFGANVLKVEEDGRSQAYGELYIVMELLRGLTLKDYLKENGSLPLEQCLLIAEQLAEGLSAIHSQGIVFRDLKPANIMITFDHKGEILVKIFDFGSVKSLRQAPRLGDVELTGAMFVGSALYASPENCMAKSLDQRADIYALGLILYEMIAGFRAFDSPNWLDLLTMQAYDPPPPLKGIPEEVNRFVMKALSKNPNDRQQTIEEFLGELRGEPGRFEKALHAVPNSDELIDEDPVGERTVSAANPPALIVRQHTLSTNKQLSFRASLTGGRIVIPTVRPRTVMQSVLMSAITVTCLTGSLVQSGTLVNKSKQVINKASLVSATTPSVKDNVEPKLDAKPDPFPLKASSEQPDSISTRHRGGVVANDTLTSLAGGKNQKSKGKASERESRSRTGSVADNSKNGKTKRDADKSKANAKDRHTRGEKKLASRESKARDRRSRQDARENKRDRSNRRREAIANRTTNRNQRNLQPQTSAARRKIETAKPKIALKNSRPNYVNRNDRRSNDSRGRNGAPN